MAGILGSVLFSGGDMAIAGQHSSYVYWLRSESHPLLHYMPKVTVNVGSCVASPSQTTMITIGAAPS